MSISVWEALFMLLVLKVPVVYLGVVVWWAVRAVPNAPSDGGDGAGVLAPLTPCGWNDWRRRRPVRGRPIRPAVRRARAATR